MIKGLLANTLNEEAFVVEYIDPLITRRKILMKALHVNKQLQGDK